MTAINFERLDDAITHGVGNPEEFNMLSWFSRDLSGAQVLDDFCGTTACLAGTAALQDGWRPVFSAGAWVTSTVVRGDRHEHVEYVAAELLGLNDDQCDIFVAESLAEVIELRNEWAREAGVPERNWVTAGAK